jgi:hypothetical protein
MPLSLSTVRTTAASALGVAALLATSAAHADLAACIASSEQALTLRRAGKLHEARAQLAQCAATACPDEVRTDCGKRMEAVNAAMPGLVLGAKDAGGSDLLAVEVSVDGQKVASSLDGRPIEVDPGEHVVRLAAEGLPPVEKTIVLGEGEKTRHEVFVLGATSTPAAAPAEESHGGWSSRKTLAVIGGATGLVGIGLGTVFGLVASSDWSDAKSAVSSQGSCTSAAACAPHQAALSDHASAETFSAASTVAFGVGGALLVAGVVTWFTAPSSSAAAPKSAWLRVLPAAGPGGATLMAVGEF